MDRDDALDYPMLYQKALAEIERLKTAMSEQAIQNACDLSDADIEIERLRAKLERANDPTWDRA